MFNFNKKNQTLSILMEQLTNPVIILDENEYPIWVNKEMNKLISCPIQNSWNYVLSNSFTRISIDEENQTGLISHLKPKSMWKVKSRIFDKKRILELLPVINLEEKEVKNELFFYNFRDILDNNFQTLKQHIKINNINLFIKPSNDERVSIPYKTLSNSYGLLLKSIIENFPSSSLFISFSNQNGSFLIDIEIRTNLKNQISILENDLEGPFRNFQSAMTPYSGDIKPYHKSSQNMSLVGLEIKFNNFHIREDVIDEISFQ